MYRFKFFKIYSVLLFCCFPLGVDAHLYVADVDEAQWTVETSPLYCRLWQGVPAYGRGIFQNNSGERQTFDLESQKKVYDKGTATIRISPPEWIFNRPKKQIAQTQTIKGFHPVLIEEPTVSNMLDELEAGMFPEIQHPGWYEGHWVEVQLSSVNFTAAYADYSQCLGDLYPANFKQLERTRILFDVDKFELKKEYFERLKLIKGYLDIDPEVVKIVVDGHTDNTGSDSYNWDLSKNRAQIVSAYLLKIGVPESKLQVRYHGERFPVAKNKSDANRQKNRRTTLRLVKNID